MRGVTLLETLLIVAAIAILAGIAFPVSQIFQTRNDLDVAATNTIQTLRRAQVLSQGVSSDSQWGVKAQSGQLTLFKGSSYASRDIASDELFDSAPSIIPSSLTEVVFQKLTGIPTATGTLLLTSSTNETRTILINSKGSIGY
ncbi:MAG: hypothetical protein Q7R79_02945 [bacterium]|nr:hypothetical protein [bacterium]